MKYIYDGEMYGMVMRYIKRKGGYVVGEGWY